MAKDVLAVLEYLWGLELAAELESDNGKVLIHCEAGVSRSTAAALVMYACWLGQGREYEAMERVIDQRPYAIPNRRMVRLADSDELAF